MIKEIQRATDLLKEEKIKVLKISDSNTTGLIGPDEKGSIFHAYMKTEGTSVSGNSRGGSHGHGKAAPLGLSAFVQF